MNWNDHSRLQGEHAFLGASNYHWLNYDIDKLAIVWRANKAKAQGTELHEFASTCIKLKQHLTKTKKTLNMFVNDAIDKGMASEQILYFSENCFGTADAICFGQEKGFNKPVLRIHDLKTGETQAHMEQLLIYAALFCLEYNKHPGDIAIELRIYQYNDILVCSPTAEDIGPIMDTIICFNDVLNNLRITEGE